MLHNVAADILAQVQVYLLWLIRTILSDATAINFLDSGHMLRRKWDHQQCFRWNLILSELFRGEFEFQGTDVVAHKGVPFEKDLHNF